VAAAFAAGFRARRSIATPPSGVYGPLGLAAAGALCFALMELCEGHLAGSTLVQASLAALPLAFLVSLAGRTAKRLAYRAGAACASAILVSPRGGAGTRYRRLQPRRPAPAPAPVLSSTRGRAPPRSR